MGWGWNEKMGAFLPPSPSFRGQPRTEEGNQPLFSLFPPTVVLIQEKLTYVTLQHSKDTDSSLALTLANREGCWISTAGIPRPSLPPLLQAFHLAPPSPRRHRGQDPPPKRSSLEWLAPPPQTAGPCWEAGRRGYGGPGRGSLLWPGVGEGWGRPLRRGRRK